MDTMYDRGEELSVIEEALDELVGQRRGNVLVVTGGAGIGRTKFLSSIVDRGLARGIVPRSAVFSNREQWLEMPIDWAGLAASDLVCLDDVQNVDEQAVSHVLELAESASSRPVLLVMSFRESASATRIDRLLGAVTLGRYRQLRLRPLSPERVEAIAAEEYRLKLGEGTAQKLIDYLAGDLSLVKGLFHDYSPHGGAEACEFDDLIDSIGGTCRSIVSDRLAGLDDEVREVLWAIAVLGEHSEPRLLASVLGEERERLSSPVSLLASTGLVDGHRISNRVVAEVIAESIPEREHSRLCRRVAQVLRDLGVSPDSVLEFLLGGGEADESWIDYLLHVGLPLSSSPEEQDKRLRALRLIFRCAPTAEQRGQAALALALSYAPVDSDVCTQYFHEAVKDLDATRLWRRYFTVIADQMTRLGRSREAMYKVNELLGTGDAATGAPPEVLHRARATLLFDMPALRDVSRCPAALGAYESTHDLPLRFLSGGCPAPAEMASARALVGADLLTAETFPFMASLLEGLVYADDLDVVRGICAELVGSARRQGAALWESRLSAIGAEAAFRAGDPVEALELVSTALQLVPSRDWGVRLAMPLSTGVLSAVELGDQRAARALVRIDLSPAAFGTRFGAHYLYAKGHHYVAEGRPQTGLIDFLSCGRLLGQWGIDREGVLPWRLAAAAAASAIGETDHAVELIAERLEREAPAGPDAGAADDVSHVGDASHLGDVAALRSRREEVYGEIAEGVRDGRLPRAVRDITVGARQERLAHQPSRYRIEDRYDSYLNFLTRSEQQVALLAAAGKSNKVIARELSLTMSTVEQHLTHTYRKLGIDGRRQLRARLG